MKKGLFLLLIPSSVLFASDWGRHSTVTFSPPGFIVVDRPQVFDTNILAETPTRSFVPKPTFQSTAKDIGGRFYQPADPTMPIWARTPPNVGENGKLK